MRLEKIHTIRKNESSKFKTGDTVSLRTWSGIPYRSKQVEFGTSEITVQPIKIIRSKPGDSHRVFIAMVFCPIQKIWVHLDSEMVAKNDGLSIADFYDWFFPRGGPTEFRGSIILFGHNFYYSALGDQHARDARQLRAEDYVIPKPEFYNHPGEED